jgi:hypothetical protein
MKLIILAKNSDDGLDWLDRFLGLPDVERTVRTAEVYDARAMIIEPSRYDRLDRELDPNSLEWLTGAPTKIIRTAAWVFDERVVSALRRLHARHRLCDPTGLLGPDDSEIDARRGWAPEGPQTAPMGVRSQRNHQRPARLTTARRPHWESLNTSQ